MKPLGFRVVLTWPKVYSRWPAPLIDSTPQEREWQMKTKLRERAVDFAHWTGSVAAKDIKRVTVDHFQITEAGGSAWAYLKGDGA